METHILFVLSIIIIAYVGMGGMLFQRVEQPQKITSDRYAIIQPEPIATFNISDTTLAVLDRQFNSTYNDPESQKLHLELLQIMALRVARFIVEEIAPKNHRGESIFNVTLATSRQLFLTKTPQLYEDWDFYGSVFFAATTITTIGYGHVAPQTEFGKIAVVLYALVGVCVKIKNIKKNWTFFN